MLNELILIGDENKSLGHMWVTKFVLVFSSL